MHRQLLTLAAVALPLAGCASGITRPGAESAPAHLSADNQVSSVSLTLYARLFAG